MNDIEWTSLLLLGFQTMNTLHHLRRESHYLLRVWKMVVSILRGCQPENACAFRVAFDPQSGSKNTSHLERLIIVELGFRFRELSRV